MMSEIFREIESQIKAIQDVGIRGYELGREVERVDRDKARLREVESLLVGVIDDWTKDKQDVHKVWCALKLVRRELGKDGL
jgi:hypothetical protein